MSRRRSLESTDEDTPARKKSSRSTANPSLKHRPTLTLVYEHDDCGDHDTGFEHQEAADRLTAIHRSIAKMDGVAFTSEFEPASEAAIRAVHSQGLVDAIRGVQGDYASGRHRNPRPLSPVLTERLFPDNKPFGMTMVSSGTGRATARRSNSARRHRRRG